MVDDPGLPPEPGQPRTARIRDRLLREREDRLGRDVADLRATVEGMQAGFSRLSAKIDKAAGGGSDEPPGPYHLSALDEQARAERVAELVSWVGTVLVPFHPAVGKLLSAKPCWVSHLDVVQAVNAAVHAFEGCHIAEQGRKPTEAAVWLRDFLPALERQVVAVVGKAMEPCSRCG